MLRRLVSLMLVTTACAVQDASSQGGTAVLRDSAGIRIVENARPSLGFNVWRLSPEPTVTIGAVEGGEDYQLYLANRAIRLDNGTIVIANVGSFHLKYFDAEGHFMVNAGGKGGGPGEFSSFRAPMYIWRSGGAAVAAWEFSPSRVSVFDADGQFVKSHLFTLKPGLLPEPIGELVDGRLVAYDEDFRTQDHTSRAPVGTMRRDSIRFFWFSTSGADWEEIAWLPGFERRSTESMRRRVWTGFNFAKRPVYAVGQRALYYGSSDTYEIASYSPDGTLHRLVRRTENNRVLSADMIDAYVERRMEEAPDDPNTRRQWQRSLDEAYWPANLPAYRRIRVDRAEHLWVQRHALTDTVHTWSVFSPEGVWLTDVTTPLDLNVQEIGDDYVLGTWDDADGVEHVLMYELIKN